MRRGYWLAAAAAAFVLGAWFMWGAESEGRAARRLPSRWEFPRRPRKDEMERTLRRRTLAARPADPDAGVAAEPRARDPVMIAMKPGSRRAVVIEASAIRDSALGRLALECWLSPRAFERLDMLEADGGIDLRGGLDRLAVSDDVVVAAGDFSTARWSQLLAGHSSRRHGGGTVYEPAADARRRSVIGTWGSGVVIAGRDRREIEAAIDRLDGRASADPPLHESEAYGEIYGVFAADELANLLPEDMQSRLRGTAERVELHVDTRDENDVLIVGDASGRDAASVEDLGKSLGVALAVARVKARHDGDDDLAELLDLARVSPERAEFRVEVALPLELMRRRFGRCAEDAGSRF